MPPEEEAFASKACGNKYKYCKKIVCRCPKQQKTTQRDQYDDRDMPGAAHAKARICVFL